MNLCLVAPNLHPTNSKLQPWRFLLDFCHQQQDSGHTITIITNHDSRQIVSADEIEGIAVRRLTSSNEDNNPALWETIHALQPERIYWNIGLTSFLHLGLQNKTSVPITGIFTAPVYALSDLYRAGINNLIRDRHLAWIHVAGALIPNFVLQRPLKNGTLHDLITLSETTRAALIQRGIPPAKIEVIKPTIQPIWSQTSLSIDEHINVRSEMGLTLEDFVVAYFGAPKRLRGIDELIEAVALALPQLPQLKLLLLSRHHAGEMSADERRIHTLISERGIEQHVRIVSGFLDLPELVQKVACADTVALPFQLVPSDVPLSILEAKALGKPVISTRISCIPELLDEPEWLVEPNSPHSLANRLCALASQKEVAHV